MPLYFEMTLHHDHVHARIGGLSGSTEALEAWHRIHRACVESGIHRILVDVRVDGSISLLELYKFGEELSRLAWHPAVRVAVVHERSFHEEMKFVDDVIRNRCGVDSRLFFDAGEALHWLRGPRTGDAAGTE